MSALYWKEKKGLGSGLEGSPLTSTGFAFGDAFLRHCFRRSCLAEALAPDHSCPGSTPSTCARPAPEAQCISSARGVPRTFRITLS